jgi:hypothetical protein
MTATESTRRPFGRRIAAGVAATGAALAITLAGAGSASAATVPGTNLSPGYGACGPAAYAGYQVHAEGTATNQGAKFKLLRNGVVIDNTPTRQNSWVVERRTSWGNFPGPGYYSVCAQNTGTANTTVTLTLLVDGQF